MSDYITGITMQVTRAKVPLRDRICANYEVGADRFQSDFALVVEDGRLQMQQNYVRQHLEHKPALVYTTELQLLPLVDDPETSLTLQLPVPIPIDSGLPATTLAEQIEKVCRGEAPADSLRGVRLPVGLANMWAAIDEAHAAEVAAGMRALVLQSDESTQTSLLNIEPTSADPIRGINDAGLAPE